MSRPTLLLAEHRPIVREVLVARLTDEGFDVVDMATLPWPERLEGVAAAILAPGFPEAEALVSACGRVRVAVLQVDEADNVGTLLDKLEELLVRAAAEKAAGLEQRAGRLDAVLEVRLGRLAATSELSATAQVILKLLDGRRTLSDVLEKSGVDRRAFLETVATLQEAGLLQPARPRTGTTLPPAARTAVPPSSIPAAPPVGPASTPASTPAPEPTASVHAVPPAPASAAASPSAAPPVVPPATDAAARRPTSEVIPAAVAATGTPRPQMVVFTDPPPVLTFPPPAQASGPGAAAAVGLATAPPPLPEHPPLRLAPAASAAPSKRSAPAESLSTIEAAEEAELAREELADFLKTRRAGSRRTLAFVAGGVIGVAAAGMWLMRPPEETPALPAAAAPESPVAIPPAPPKVTEALPPEPPEPAPSAEAQAVAEELKSTPPEPAEAEPVKPEPEPVVAEPVKPEPVAAEPVKPEPVKPEPVKPAAAKATDPAAEYDALVKRGREAAAKGKWQKAAEAFEAALKARPTAAVAFELGQVMFDAERFPRAREAFQTAVRLEPKRAEAQFYLGVTDQNLGKDVEARKAYEAALKAGLSGVQAAEARKALKALR